MGYNATTGVITMPGADYDSIGLALGVASRDINTLCGHANTNIWAKWKAIKVITESGGYTDTPGRLTLACVQHFGYGLYCTPVVATSSDWWDKVTEVAAAGWKYDAPVGNYHHRPSDFLNPADTPTSDPHPTGYDRNAVAPLGRCANFNESNQVYFDLNSYGQNLNFFARLSEETSGGHIAFSELPWGNESGSVCYMAMIFRRLVTGSIYMNYILFCEDPATQLGGSIIRLNTTYAPFDSLTAYTWDIRFVAVWLTTSQVSAWADYIDNSQPMEIPTPLTLWPLPFPTASDASGTLITQTGKHLGFIMGTDTWDTGFTYIELDSRLSSPYVSGNVNVTVNSVHVDGVQYALSSPQLGTIFAGHTTFGLYDIPTSTWTAEPMQILRSNISGLPATLPSCRISIEADDMEVAYLPDTMTPVSNISYTMTYID